MASQKSYEVEHTEEPYASSRQTAGQRSKRHCARFWWIYLIVLSIIVLVVALCLVFVAMPRIAQSGVNESWLEFTDIEFNNPTENSITLTQKGILHSPSMYTPTLDPFNASLYLVTNGIFGSEPIMTVSMPRIHALHTTSNVGIDSQYIVYNSLDQVTAYTVAALSGENVTTALVGKTKLHEGKLPTTNVNYNSSSTYKGLNGLKGFNVTNAHINLTAPAGTPNMIGNAFIPNPSPMTILMGDVFLTLSTTMSGIIGNATIQNMTLVPGDNNLPMTAIVDQPLVISNLNSTGYITLQITGQTSVYNGQHLTYYEKALQGNPLSLDLNIKGILASG